jgi:hypothetical protein
VSPVIPGQPMLVPLIRPWLVHRVALESPLGAGWTPEATGVEARIIDRLESVVDPRTGGLLQVQRSTLYVLHGVTVRANWQVTRADTGQVYTTGAPIDNAEAPTVEVPLKAAH